MKSEKNKKQFIYYHIFFLCLFQPKTGHTHYENLCMKAVNQSVGKHRWFCFNKRKFRPPFLIGRLNILWLTLRLFAYLNAIHKCPLIILNIATFIVCLSICSFKEVVVTAMRAYSSCALVIFFFQFSET